MLNTFSPENVWFTSDTHFWHGNIIRFCNRPFETIEKMNEELIRPLERNRSGGRSGIPPRRLHFRRCERVE